MFDKAHGIEVLFWFASLFGAGYGGYLWRGMHDRQQREQRKQQNQQQAQGKRN